MASQNRKRKNNYLYAIFGLAILAVIIAFGFGISLLLSDDENGRQSQVQTVTLLTPPPPPPKIEEKPPVQEEPEEEIETPEEQPAEKPEDTPQDAPPAEELGLDADAGLGSDAFGLKAKKGGRSLIGGKGTGSLYGWYANVVSSELQKTANEIIQQNGGIPPGKWQKVRFEVMLDVSGQLQKFSIVKSSGNEKIDAAVKKALQMTKQFEPPPPGMPRVLKFGVLLQG